MSDIACDRANTIHHAHGTTTLGTSFHATVHCLTGCVIGETLGLLIGVALGIGVFWTITLAVLLAFVVGMSLGVLPIMRREKLSIMDALRVIWLGEVISITVMEIAMNTVAFAVGGITAPSIFAPIFWIGMLAAVPAGFLAAWPVNHWLLSRHLKKCH